MKRLLGSVLLVTYILPQLVYAEEAWKGMSIFRYCMGDTVLFAPAVCRAYIQGVADTYQITQKKSKEKREVCVPNNKIAREKGEHQVSKWINFFKERRNERPIIVISDALGDIFPCKK